MWKILYGLAFSLVLFSMVSGCYDDCLRKFDTEFEKAGQLGNSSERNSDYCKAVANQVGCLHSVMNSCPAQRQVLIQNMLVILNQPQYQQYCVGQNPSTLQNNADILSMGSNNFLNSLMQQGSMNPPASMLSPTMSAPGATPMVSNTQTLLLCSQKVKACQINFNKTFSSFVASYNVSGICQSLKMFTNCLMELVSSDCESVVGMSQSRNLVYTLQQQYGGMCSSDAQATTRGMLDCMNKTMKCYTEFNRTFVSALATSDMVTMCKSLDNYTSCSQTVKQAPECGQTAGNSLTSNIAMMTQRYNVYCGEDSGQTAHQCMQRFQECFRPFNESFFPALHQANLSQVCRSLTTYTLCVGKLTPICSQQLRDMLQSAQNLRMQFSAKCHPKILQISQCEPLTQCSKTLMRGFPAAVSTNTGLCGYIGNYFPCVASSLEQCNLPQSTTVVSFRSLGTLMQSYCGKLSSNSKLLRCPSFVRCTAAILLSFSPNVTNMFEGSTWCTFMQMSVGCAEHAFQASSCSLAGDMVLQKDIQDLDKLRIQTCETGGSVTGTGNAMENMVDPGHQKDSHEDDKDEGDDNGGALVYVPLNYVLMSTLLSSLTIYQNRII